MIDIDDVATVESPSASSKNITTRGKRSINGITLPISSKMESNSSAKTAITRDELLSLYILKLDEEANYFKVSPTSPEEELCDCSKCQVRTFLNNISNLKHHITLNLKISIKQSING